DEKDAAALMEIVEPSPDDAEEDERGRRLDPGCPPLLQHPAAVREPVGLHGVVRPADHREQLLAVRHDPGAVERRHERWRRLVAARRGKPGELAIGDRAVGPEPRDPRSPWIS